MNLKSNIQVRVDYRDAGCHRLVNGWVAKNQTRFLGFPPEVREVPNTGHGQLFAHLVGALLERHYLKLIKSVRLSVDALGFKGSFVAFALF
jgi:hypothetical protein